MTKRIKKKAKKRRKPQGKSRRLPITEAEVRRLGLECESLTVAESLAKLPGRYSAIKPSRRLNEIFKTYPQLRQAWDRGRFLRNLRGLARTGVSVSEAAKKLGFANGRVLRAMINEDQEVGDLWAQTQLEVYIEIKTAIVNAAKEGKADAVRVVEGFLLDEKEHPGFDPSRITILQLTELMGKTRQTIHEWFTKFGMPRNADKTFDLSIFLAWYEEFLLKRAPVGRESPIVLDPLKTIKTEKLKLELAHHRHQLLDRSEVICGQIAWVQNVVTFCERGVEEFSRLCCNQPREKIAELARGFFRDLHSEASKVLKELRLPASKERELIEFLQAIKPYDERNKND